MLTNLLSKEQVIFTDELPIPCYCGKGKYVKKQENIRLNMPLRGLIYVENCIFYECSHCLLRIILTEDMEVIRIAERKDFEKFIGSTPLKECLTPKQAAEILGIPYQKLSSREYKEKLLTGKIGKEKFYLYKSVMMFKETGDGRPVIFQTNKN